MNTHKVSFYMQLDEYDEGINYYVSPRRGIRFVFDPVSDLSLSLSSFWNNSATVREGVTQFEMPRQKLLNNCLFLFIAPFDL